MVAPIFTEAQLKKSWLEENNIYYYLRRSDKELAAFADYTAEALKKAVKEDRKLKLVNTLPGQTLLFSNSRSLK